MKKPKQITITLTEDEATILTSILLFVATIDICGEWSESDEKKFLKLAEKFRKLGITDLRKYISAPDETIDAEESALLQKLTKKYKLSTWG